VSSNPPSRPSLHEGRVLLVDDEGAVANAHATWLTRQGFDAVPVLSAEEALALASQEDFDAVVTDINMPEMSGVELLRALREYDRDVPVILLTGAPAIESAAEAVNYGALQYLMKPVPPDQLTSSVRRAVQLNRLAAAKRLALQELGTHTGEGGRASLEASFELALESLWVAFQPIVSKDGGKLYGYEALLRSEEPTLPHPGSLLDAAERLGRLGDLGSCIRRRALATLTADQEWILFLNLHPQDLADDTLLDDLLEHHEHLPRLVLEVTERASLEQVPAARERIASLREAGCRIAVDDLGAGYAGLSSFVQLEPDVVKLDTSLVRDADSSPVKQRLIRSLTEVCKDLGYSVVGEGVETEGERDVLIDLGCDLLQGYRFGRPERPFVQPSW
jgi:EAL domain-containing protein (putative c-di-GMP-specific phosphodiesterase class I)